MQPEDKSRLRPQLNLFDAVATGLAAILGAGIFSVIAPAAGIAGPAFLASLSIAALIALCNALSSAQLASIFRDRVGHTNLDVKFWDHGGDIWLDGCS
jgi:basic amino acid/polyamine antiporter, APA family